MTKFEEEVKRPDNTGIEPFSKRDVDFSKIAEKFARGAQTLKKWREYADYKEHQLEQKDEQIQELKVALKEALDLQCEANNQAAKEYIDRCEAESKLKSLKSQLQQQALPVVPECVAEWYEEHKADLDFSIFEACVSLYDDNSSDFKKWFGNSENKSIETLVRMKDGYQVEKPQLFYLKHIDMSKTDKEFDWYLTTNREKLCHNWVVKEYKPQDDDFKFTQQEIESMETGSYEQIKVEDGE